MLGDLKNKVQNKIQERLFEHGPQKLNDLCKNVDLHNYVRKHKYKDKSIYNYEITVQLRWLILDMVKDEELSAISYNIEHPQSGGEYDRIIFPRNSTVKMGLSWN